MLGLPRPQLPQLPSQEERLQLQVQRLLCGEEGLEHQGEEGERQGSLVGFLEEELVFCSLEIFLVFALSDILP